MPDSDRVHETLRRALAARGFDTLTPVQSAVSAAEPRDADMLVSASTGSGKTVACGMALAVHLLDEAGGEGPRAIVLTPTRELADQVRRELAWLYAMSKVRLGCCAGGSDMGDARLMLAECPQLLVATPGRLRHHLAHGHLSADAVGCVVLDEADDMLRLGFREDIDAILGALPADRRTLMFSATVSSEVEALAVRYLRAPLRIAAGPPGRNLDIRFEGVVAAARDREAAVVNVLRYHEAPGALVFCSRRVTVGDLGARLAARGFEVVTLSGCMRQRDRNAALEAMRSGRARVCVATDVAARGLDLPALDLVIHADPPVTHAALIHRSGRTGRAGRGGVAVIVATPRQRRRFDALTSPEGPRVAWGPAPRRAEIESRDAARLEAAAILTRDAQEAERHRATGLLETFAPERLAVALHRAWSGALPDVVDIRAGPPAESGLGGTGVWFCMNHSPGRKSGIRAIRARIAGSGAVGVGDVGRIHILERETHFELRAELATAFEAAFRAAEAGTLCLNRLEGPFRPFVPCAVREDQTGSEEA